MFSKIKKNLGGKASAALATALLMGSQGAQAASSSSSSITSDDCQTGTLGGMACNLRQNLGEFGALIIAFFYLIGFGLTGLGVYFFWKNEQQPNQDHGKKGAVAILVGGGLLSLVYIVDASSQSLTGEESDATNKLDANVGSAYD